MTGCVVQLPLSFVRASGESQSLTRLHESTGAEIETALCILESVLSLHVGITLGNLDLGIWGASETRKLGIWNLGVPWARTQEGCSSETRKLVIWNLGVPSSRQSDVDDVPPAPREAPPGFKIADGPPSAEQLAFSKEKEAPGDALVGKSVLYNWPVVGLGQVVERNTDGRSF